VIREISPKSLSGIPAGAYGGQAFSKAAVIKVFELSSVTRNSVRLRRGGRLKKKLTVIGYVEQRSYFAADFREHLQADVLVFQRKLL
jgi:hypothetical protein